MLPEKLAFVDIETTGLSVTRDRIIEIGLLRVENNTVTKTFQTLLNPGGYISPSIFSMTGISPEKLEYAPSFSDIKDQLSELLHDAVFVAHNVRFDYGFIRNEFSRLGKAFTTKHFCTIKLSKYLFPAMQRYNLDTVIERFNLQCANRHRAFDDAKVIADYYQILQKQFLPNDLANAVNQAMKKPNIPVNIDSKLLQSLPEKPGVYIFYGKKGTPLYVGKSINVKDRVLSHFSNDHSSNKEMKISQQVESIETIETAGELGALLEESLLVKKLQPLYNRRLRIARKVVILKKYVTPEGYYSLQAETVGAIDPDIVPDIIGVFKSQRQAKEFLLSGLKPHNLCEKLLGLQKTKSSCFSYQLGYCRGSCIKKETPLAYNIRFLEAFLHNTINPWPFRGPIIIQEKDFFAQVNESFIIDKWCLIGSIKETEGTDNELLKQEYQFDVDTYKILLQYIKNPRNRNNIRNFSHSLVSQKKNE